MSRNLLYSARFYVVLFVLVLLFTFVGSAHCQVSVAIAPDPHPQFVNGSGQLLSGGFLYTYQAGTTTFLNTYTDSRGTIQNLDPIPLDATGAPSNGSVGTGIWLANAAYKFCAYNSSMVQQWCADNLTGYLGLLNLANVWSFQQTFSLPLIDTATDNQIVLGAVGNQTTLDFPPPTGDVAIHFPNVPDTMVGTSETATICCKTFTSTNLVNPSINSVAMPNGPGTYIQLANSASIGTAYNTPTKLTGTPSTFVAAATSDTGGIVGICVANCGTTGNAVVEQSGVALCIFDGATAAGDYVQNSGTHGAECHDVGATYPSNGSQVLGRALSTNAASGVYLMDLFGPEIQPLGSNSSIPTLTIGAAAGSGASVGCTNCTDAGGTALVNTGPSGTAPGIVFTITFGGSHHTATCSFSASDSVAATPVASMWGFATPPGWEMVTGATLSTSTQYLWSYQCSFT